MATNKLCSIDASTNSLAFAIFDGDRLVKYGKINFSGVGIFAKVGDAARKTKALFELFDIDRIAIEHTVFMNSPKTVGDLALVQGALLGAAISTGINTVRSINPITWQTYINNGKIKKEEKVQIMNEFPNKSTSWYKNKEREIRKQRTINIMGINYDVVVTDHDVADAIGIGHYALNNWEKLGS
jgi:Holliday junction resolvasome RuvABC endonuclease subunit